MLSACNALKTTELKVESLDSGGLKPNSSSANPSESPAGPPTGFSLELELPGEAVHAGDCLPIHLSFWDSNGKSAKLQSAQVMTLNSSSSQESVGIYLNENCAGSSDSQATIPHASESFTLYTRFTKTTQAVSVQVENENWGSGTSPFFSVLPSNDQSIEIYWPTEKPVQIEAGDCIGPIRFRRVDVYGNLASNSPVFQTEVSLAPQTGALFYQDAICENQSGPNVQVHFNSNSVLSNEFLFFRATEPETYAIKETNSFSSIDSLSVSSGPLHQIHIALPSSIKIGDCHPVTFGFLDEFGNAFASDLPFEMTVTPKESLHQDPSCTQKISSQNMSIPPGKVLFTLYFKTIDFFSTVSVTAKVGVLSATQPIALTTGKPSHIQLYPPSEMNLGTCYLVDFAILAEDGLVGVFGQEKMLSLSATPANANIQFFSNKNCTTKISSYPLPAQTYAGKFYFRANQALTPSATITVKNPELEMVETSIPFKTFTKKVTLVWKPDQVILFGQPHVSGRLFHNGVQIFPQNANHVVVIASESSLHSIHSIFSAILLEIFLEGHLFFNYSEGLKSIHQDEGINPDFFTSYDYIEEVEAYIESKHPNYQITEKTGVAYTASIAENASLDFDFEMVLDTE